MIINPDKCSYICLGKNNNDDDTFSFNEFSLKNSNEETIFGIKIDQKLAFSSHIQTLCTKAGQNLCAVSRISNYLDQNKKTPLV